MCRCLLVNSRHFHIRRPFPCFHFNEHTYFKARSKFKKLLCPSVIPLISLSAIATQSACSFFINSLSGKNSRKIELNIYLFKPHPVNGHAAGTSGSGTSSNWTALSREQEIDPLDLLEQSSGDAHPNVETAAAVAAAAADDCEILETEIKTEPHS